MKNRRKKTGEKSKTDKSKINKKALKFGLSLGIIIAFFGLSIFGVKYYYKGKIYPLVKIGGISVGGLKTDQASNRVLDYYSPKRLIKLTFQGSFLETTQQDIGAQIIISDALASAYQFGRSLTTSPKIDLTSKVDHVKLSNILSNRFSEFEKPAKDAFFELDKKNNLKIVKEEYGTAFNVPLIGLSIAEKILTPGAIEVEVTTKLAEPTIKSSHLDKIQVEYQNLLNKKFYAKVDSITFYLSKIEKQNIIKPAIVDGDVAIVADQDGISQYVDSLYKKTFVSSRPEVYFTNGEKSEDGADGRSIDKEEAKALLTKAVEDKLDKPVFLASNVSQKSKKTIEKPFTPGAYEGKYIEVDLSSQTLYQFEGENMIGSHRVSTGKWSMPTPVGTYSINGKNPRAYSKTYNLYMPYWMSFIGSKYGLHELPEWANGTKEGESHLGTPVSHGCIRMGVGSAGAVYDWAEVGTIVYVHK